MPIWLRITLWLVLWLLLIVGALWLIVHIKATLMIFAVAFLISYLLNPAVTAMEGRRLGPIRRVPRVVAVIVLYAVLGSLLIAVGAIVVPLVVDQVSSLAERAPSLAATIQSKILSARDTYLQKVPPNVRANIETSLASSAETIGTWLKVVFSYMGRFLASTFSSAFIFLTAMLLAFYMLLSWKRLAAGTLAAVPRIYRDEARDLMAKMHQIFGGYLRATIITSAVCGLSTLVLLLGLRWLTGRANPYILIISITATLCYPIPLVNALVPPLLGGILAYLPENNTAYALMVAGVIALTNIVVDRTLSPKLMSEAIGVSPLFVMFAAFAGGELMGVWGMLLGIPLAAMAKALLAWVHGRFLVAPEMLGEPRPVQGMPRQGSSAASLRGGPGLAPSRALAESPPEASSPAPPLDLESPAESPGEPVQAAASPPGPASPRSRAPRPEAGPPTSGDRPGASPPPGPAEEPGPAPGGAPPGTPAAPGPAEEPGPALKTAPPEAPAEEPGPAPGGAPPGTPAAPGPAEEPGPAPGGAPPGTPAAPGPAEEPGPALKTAPPEAPAEEPGPAPEAAPPRVAPRRQPRP